MKAGIRTLLSRLAANSEDHLTFHTTTYVIPAQPSPPIHHPPPRVQPTIPVNPIFQGRDRFTTDQLVRHHLDRSQRSILRKQAPSDPAYPDTSPYAGDWSPGAPPFNFWDQGANLCELWRHRVQNPVSTEALEAIQREARMEGRVVRELEPEFTRAVDKEDFRRRMFVQFGWRDGFGPTLPPVDIGGGDGVSEVSTVAEGGAVGEIRPGRITAWPTALSMFVPPREGDNISSLSPIGTDEMLQPHIYYPSSHYQLPVGEKQAVFHEHYPQEEIGRRTADPNPFEDNSYPISNYWDGSVYSLPRDRRPDARKPSPKLWMKTEPEPPGPTLVVPFSWPEIPPSTSTDSKLVPPLPLSQRSFLSFSKDQPVHVLGRKGLPRAETAPQIVKNNSRELDGERFEKLEKMATADGMVGRDSLTLQEKLRESRMRFVRTEVERLEGEEASRKKRGLGGWLSRLRQKEEKLP